MASGPRSPVPKADGKEVTCNKIPALLLWFLEFTTIKISNYVCKILCLRTTIDRPSTVTFLPALYVFVLFTKDRVSNIFFHDFPYLETGSVYLRDSWCA